MKAMQQETIGPEHSEETLTLENSERESSEPLPYGRRVTVFTMIGVLSVVFLAMLDQTIVGTAMPHIVADLQGFDLITWVSTAYLLTSTVPIPICGKLSDLFGRKPIMLFGIVIFLIGSALSGAAQNMEQLIAFRAFQGLGAAALEPMAITIIGDLFPPRERGKWQGIGGSSYGLAAIVGPLAGGWITDNVSWRWVFYINLPIGLLAMLVLVFLMPTLRHKVGQVNIDYIGAGMLILGTVPLLLGFTLAGNQYAWLSPQIISLFSGAVIILFVFVYYSARLERQGGEPIFEPGLIRNSVRIYGVSLLVTVIYSVSLYGTAFAIPLFAQGVLGTSATNSGLILMPFMLTAIGGSVLSGLALTLTGKYKWVAMLGIVIDIVGTFMLVRLDANSSYTLLVIAMLVLGLGVGSGLAVYTTAVQNVYPKKIGEASSTLVFFRQLGGTIGLAAMGSVLVSSYVPAFHAELPEALRQFLPANILGAFDNPLILLSPDMLSHIRTGFAGYGERGTEAFNILLQAVKTGLAQSVHNVFVLSLVIILFGLFAVFFLKEIPLRERNKAD